MTNNKICTICYGNDAELAIFMKRYDDQSGEYIDFDLSQVTDLCVLLTCSNNNTEIPLEYTIDQIEPSLLHCPINYRYLQPNASYGVIVAGVDAHDKHWRFCLMPREGFKVIPNTSGVQKNDIITTIDVTGQIGFGNIVLDDFYTKEQVDVRLATKQNTLVSGTNIKTINNQSVLGSGNIEIESLQQVQADWTQNDSSSAAYIQHKPTFATVATSGNYNDLTNKPTIPAAQVNSDWNSNSGVSKILNKPTLATVATSGNYNDLTNKPTIPAAQVNSDWNSNSGVSQILNKPTLAAVATSGSYGDLTGTPDLSTKQDTLVSGTNIKTINNQSLLGSGNIDIQGGGGTQVQSDWTENDSSSVAYIQHKPTLATVATSGSYGDLTGKPTLATVATSGSYGDLSGKPTNVSSFNNDAGYITLNDMYAYEPIPESWVTNTCSTWELVNIIRNDIDAIPGKVYAGTIYTLTDFPVSMFQGEIKIEIIGTGVYGSTILMTLQSADTAPYVWMFDAYGSVPPNPSAATANWRACTQVNSDWNSNSGVSQILNKPTLATVATSGSYGDLTGTPTLATVATSGNYNDLTNKPTIPAAQVNSDWNSNSGVSQILNKPTLAAVATSGSYGDLSGKPTLATVATSGSYGDLTGTPDLTYKVGSTTQNLRIEVVSAMPASPDANTIYIVSNNI